MRCQIQNPRLHWQHHTPQPLSISFLKENYAQTEKRVVDSNEIIRALMSNSPLLKQLAHRAQRFHESTGISQSMMAAAIHMTEPNYSSFLKGSRGLSADSTCLLLKYVNLPEQQAIAKFTQSPITSKVMLLQENGRRMRLALNDGWVPGQSGTDLNGIGSIDDTPSADTTAPAWDQDLIDSLRETRGLHRQAIRAINKYINQAKANAGIVTPTGVQQKFSRR
jgi:hypothetical protein